MTIKTTGNYKIIPFAGYFTLGLLIICSLLPFFWEPLGFLRNMYDVFYFLIWNMFFMIIAAFVDPFFKDVNRTKSIAFIFLIYSVLFLAMMGGPDRLITIINLLFGGSKGFNFILACLVFINMIFEAKKQNRTEPLYKEYGLTITILFISVIISFIMFFIIILPLFSVIGYLHGIDYNEIMNGLTMGLFFIIYSAMFIRKKDLMKIFNILSTR